MTSHEYSEAALSPAEEFAAAKAEADEVFSEIALELARAITAEGTIEKIRTAAQVEDDEKITLTSLIRDHIDHVFQEQAMEDYDLYVNTRPEFAKVVDIVNACPHANKALIKIQDAYEAPYDDIKVSFKFLADRAVVISKGMPSTTDFETILANTQITFRQIANLYNYQGKIFADETLPNDLQTFVYSPAKRRYTLAHRRGVQAVRAYIEHKIDADMATSQDSESPRPTFSYDRGCPALRKPEGETEDAFDVMWAWCVKVIADPKLQHLLHEEL